MCIALPVSILLAVPDMSLSSPPLTGYVDYQRNVANDGPVIVNPPDTITEPWSSGPIPVSQYWGVTTQMGPISGSFYVQYTWYTDETLDTALASKTVQVNEGAANYFPYIIPNLGPWLTVTIAAPTGEYPVVFSFIASATNRPSVMPTPATPDVSLNTGGVAIPAGTTEFFNQAQAYAGPAMLTVDGSQSYSTTIQVWNGSGWVTIFAEAGLAAGFDNYTVVMPLSTWRVGITNGGAVAGTFTATITPSVTGST
jgi:hypothetical protein